MTGNFFVQWGIVLGIVIFFVARRAGTSNLDFLLASFGMLLRGISMPVPAMVHFASSTPEPVLPPRCRQLIAGAFPHALLDEVHNGSVRQGGDIPNFTVFGNIFEQPTHDFTRPGLG